VNAALVIAEASDQPVWWLFGATVALATFAALGLLGLLDARRTRYGGAVAEIARRWDDPDVRESFQLSREYGEEGLSELIRALFEDPSLPRAKSDSEDWAIIGVWPNLLETIGVLMTRRVISEDIVYETWGLNIVEEWRWWERPVTVMREVTGTPGEWRAFERLARRMAERFDWQELGVPQNAWQSALRLFRDIE
jgi:hypothetical protein